MACVERRFLTESVNQKEREHKMISKQEQRRSAKWQQKLKASLKDPANWKRDPGTPFPLPPEMVSAAIPIEPLVYIGVDTTVIDPATLPLNEYRALIGPSESSDPSKGEKMPRSPMEKQAREIFNSQMRRATRARKALSVLEEEGFRPPDDVRDNVNRKTESSLNAILNALLSPKY
jgi:hypothetical protein